MEVSSQHTDYVRDGKRVVVYTLSNLNGMTVKLANYGGVVMELHVPDRNGNIADVVLGLENVEDYWNQRSRYLGAIVGRYINRIANGRFVLDGQKHEISKNKGTFHQHGGIKGFDKCVWEGGDVSKDGRIGVELRYVSKDGDEGYPGELCCTVTYCLSRENELSIEYQATTTKPTPVNLSYHGYFNLEGQCEGDILFHEIMLDADYFVPVDEHQIPTGELRAVKNSPMDFTSAKPIGRDIGSTADQIKLLRGFDHTWVINREEGREGGASLAARVLAPKSGRVMEVRTTEPGVHFYAGNNLDGLLTGKDGKVYEQYTGFCLETQHYPDSPNQPTFPSCILRPGEIYQTSTHFRFLTE